MVSTPRPGPPGHREGSGGTGGTAGSRPPELGPHLVGRRVVVRRILHGQRGPTGGPAFTDLLGVMESWADGATTVRSESGERTRIEIGDIVSGKAVPQRPSVGHRVSAEEAQTRANACWPALHTQPVGRWLMRASNGYTSRANSVLAGGDPGIPCPEALAGIRDFYASHSLPALAQVIVDSSVDLRLSGAGWQPSQPGQADIAFQVASVATAARGASAALPAQPPSVTCSTTPDPAWLATDERAAAFGETARAVLAGPEQVCFAAVPDPLSAERVVAAGRVACAGDWAGITNVWVSPAHRGQRLATVVMRTLLAWAAEHGATTVYLQVRADNSAALASYQRLGFRTHHHYRYLFLPRDESQPQDPSPGRGRVTGR